jgi:transposase
MPSKQARRRRHSAELKAKVLVACGEPGASVAAIALAHDLNANLVHKWRRGRGAAPMRPIMAGATVPEFVALSLPATPSAAAQPTPALCAPDIRVAIERGSSRVNISWPVTAAAECAAWLRELLR